MGTGNPAGAGSAAGEVEAGPRAAPAPLGLLLHRPPAGQGAEGPWVHAANLPPTCSRLMLCGPGAWGSAASSPEQGPPERSPCRFSPVSAWTSQGESAGSQGSLLRMPPQGRTAPLPSSLSPPYPTAGLSPRSPGTPQVSPAQTPLAVGGRHPHAATAVVSVSMAAIFPFAPNWKCPRPPPTGQWVSTQRPVGWWAVTRC